MLFKTLCSFTKKLFLAGVLMLAVSIAAPAYTIVLRSGERVRIPDQFVLTGTTLTYEIAPSVNRTILLNMVDITATERANNETGGALQQRIATAAASDKPLEVGASNVALSAQQPIQKPRAREREERPTLTNRDLENLRRRNKASSQAYELQRRELPTLTGAEQKRRADEQLRFMQDLDDRRAEQMSETEDQFRTQTQELRLELAEVNAELNYYRARLAEATSSSSLTSLATPSTTIIGIPPVAYPYSFGGIVTSSSPVFGGQAFGAPNLRPPVLGVPFGRGRNSNFINTRRSSSFGIGISTGISIGGGVRGGIAVGGRYVRRDVRDLRARRGYQQFYGYPYGIGVPFIGYPPVSDDVTQIRERVRELEAARQRLFARHRVLEEEARRAGVAPGVLR